MNIDLQHQLAADRRQALTASFRSSRHRRDARGRATRRRVRLGPVDLRRQTLKRISITSPSATS